MKKVIFFPKSYILRLIGRFFALGIGKQVSIGMILGVCVGVFLRVFDTGIDPAKFKILGDIFLDLVKMTVVPLIFAAITSAILSMEDMSRLGKSAIQGIKLFMTTNVCGVLIGLFVAISVAPGLGSGIDTAKLELSGSMKKLINTSHGKTGLMDKIINIIPDNVFKAMYNADLLQVMFFAVIFGISVAVVRDKIEKSIYSFITDLAEVMYGMVKIVMKFAPFGIFGLMVWIAGVQDVKVIIALIKLVFSAFIGIGMLIFFLYPLMFGIRFRMNPLIFIKKMIPVQLFALATGSSAATLPMNMKNAQEKLGVTKESSNLLMPIGTSIDMNGNACILALYSVFVAQVFSIPIEMHDYFTIGVVCFLSSMGSPPIPGGAVIMLSGVLSTLGYPIEALSLIFAIDKMIGPMRTAGNVTGEAFAPMYIDRLNNKLDKEKYYKV